MERHFPYGFMPFLIDIKAIYSVASQPSKSFPAEIALIHILVENVKQRADNRVQPKISYQLNAVSLKKRHATPL